jgi:hypothetical protein
MALMMGPCIFLRTHAAIEGTRKVASSNMGKNLLILLVFLKEVTA